MQEILFNITKAKKSSSSWTKSEDDLLLKLTENSKYIRWAKIISNFKNKTKKNCKSRFRQIDKRHQKGRWTKEEDQTLLILVETFGESWKFISNIMKTRNDKQVRSRYINFIFHGINKKKFTAEEDKILLEKFSEFKQNWVQYTKYLENRSPRQVENRLKSLKVYLLRELSI